MDISYHNKLTLHRDYTVLTMRKKHLEYCNNKYQRDISKIKNKFVAFNKIQKINNIKKIIDKNNVLLDRIEDKQTLFNDFLNIDHSIVNNYLNNCTGFLLERTNSHNNNKSFLLINYDNLSNYFFPTYFTCLDNVKYMRIIRSLVKSGYYITHIDFSGTHKKEIYSLIDVMALSYHNKTEQIINNLNNLDTTTIRLLLASDNNTITNITFSDTLNNTFSIHNGGIIMVDSFNDNLCNKAIKDLNQHL